MLYGFFPKAPICERFGTVLHFFMCFLSSQINGYTGLKGSIKMLQQGVFFSQHPGLAPAPNCLFLLPRLSNLHGCTDMPLSSPVNHNPIGILVFQWFYVTIFLWKHWTIPSFFLSFHGRNRVMLKGVYFFLVHDDLYLLYGIPTGILEQ
jgi:hypothetical protein